VALDGTKIAAPASVGQNRTGAGLVKAAADERVREAARAAARRAARAHAEADADEDARFGEGHGDQMSDEDAGGHPAGPGRSRSVRIAEAKAAVDEQARREQAARQTQTAEREARIAAKGGRPVDGRPPAGTEIVLAEQALAAARAAAAARSQEWQATGRGRRPAEVDAHPQVQKATARLARARQRVAARDARQPRRERVGNITDPQSGLQPLAGGGWLQGYNAQAVTTSDGLILATGVSNNPADQVAFIPMLQKATEIADRVGAGQIGLILADAGYLSIDNLTAPGPDRLIAVGTRRNVETAARAAQQPAENRGGGRGGGDAAIQTMRDRLATPDGIAAYRQRSQIAETTFGHAKHNLRFRRFTGIGLDRDRTEWTFHAAVHNLSKIINHGLAPLPATG
jgi:hypothetical protein